MFYLDIGRCLFFLGNESTGILGDIKVDLTILNTFNIEDVGLQFILKIKLVSLGSIRSGSGKRTCQCIFKTVFVGNISGWAECELRLGVLRIFNTYGKSILGFAVHDIVLIEYCDDLGCILSVGRCDEYSVFGSWYEKYDQSENNNSKDSKADDYTFLSWGEFIPPLFYLFDQFLQFFGHFNSP